MDHQDSTRAAAAHAAETNGHRPVVVPPDDHLDALADLFLGPATTGQDNPRPAGHPDRPRIEAVVLGHLPSSASAWPGQCARRRAEDLGSPVAVVRLSGATLAIDLIGAGRPEEPLPDDRAALEFVRRIAGAAILRVDESRETDLVALPGLDSLCLLTGADDAAIVACYRKLKGLAARGRGMPQVRLTVMGAELEKATSAYERISRAASAFLDAELIEPVVIDRIGPTGSSAIYQAPTALSLGDIAEILTTEQPTEQPAKRPPQTPEPGRPSPTVQAAPPRAPATPAPVPAPPTDSPDRAERVSDLVEGLGALETRCPLAPMVELAADDTGRLHLVCAALALHPAVSSADPLGELLVAAAWARTNAAVLARAEPRVVDGDAALHLVTDRPKLARSLLDTPVRIHLAAEARPRAFGMVAVPLA